MIDNQADYEKIFRVKARLPRSPSHQDVSPQPIAPPSSSAGFPVQTPSTTEAPSVKPKSPPPQVISTVLFYLCSRKKLL